MRHHTLQEPVRALGLAVALSSMALIGCHDEAAAPTTPLTSPTAPQPPPPSINVRLSPQELRLPQGESGAFALRVSRYGGYTGTVAIDVSGAPAGVMAVYEPFPLNPAGPLSSLTVTTSATAPVGVYPLTVTGSGSDAVSGTATATLTIAPAASPLQPNLQVWADAEEGGLLYTVAGDNWHWPITVKRSGGFTGGVSFSVEGLPVGATASFDPPTLEPGYTKTTVALSAATVGLESNITIRARGDGVPDATATYRFASAPSM